MTKEERTKRIEQLEEKRFLINMADFLDEFDKIELRKIREELEELRKNN